MKKKQTQANRYNLQHHNPSTCSGSTENTNEESPSAPIKATALFLLSEDFKSSVLQSSSKNGFVWFFLCGLTWNRSALPVNRWLFIIATAVHFVTGRFFFFFWVVFFLFFFFFFFSFLSATLQLERGKHCWGCTKQSAAVTAASIPTQQAHSWSSLSSCRVSEHEQHVSTVQMLPFMVCHLSRNPPPVETSAKILDWWARAWRKLFRSRQDGDRNLRERKDCGMGENRAANFHR